MKLAYILIIVGLMVNLADAATGGRLYTQSGPVKAVNDLLPVNIGMTLMLAGAALLLWEKMS